MFEKITSEEWARYVKSQPDFYHSPDLGDDYVHIEGLGDGWPFYWDDYGEINTQYPTNPFIERMLKTATELNAMVVGDDNERYEATSFGFRLVTDHDPPTILEYHKNSTTGDFVEVVRQKKSEPKPGRLEIALHWPEKKERIVLRTSLALVAIVVLVLGGLWLLYA